MNLLRSVSTFSALTLVSRMLGLARDIVISRGFGASAATDAFFVAFKIPNFLRRLFAEGSFSLAFVPVLSEYRERGDQAALKSMIDATAGCLLAVLLVLTGIGVLAAPGVVALFAPGFADQPEQQALAASLLRITFPYLPLIALTALAGGILNTLGRFAIPALTPALLNICLIVAALGFAQHIEPPVEALAWGVLAAGVVQLLVQLPVLASHGVLPRPRVQFGHSGVRRILKLMLPTLFGSSVAQINLLIDVLIASLLIEASISWLYYGDRLMEFPLGLFGVALSVVVLPTLSSLHARDDRQAFRNTLQWAMRLALLIALPAAAGLLLLAQPIVTTLFHYGEFSVVDVRMAALALACYCLGLPAFIAVKILAPAFYARQDTATPVRIGIIALVTNMVLNLIFVMLIAGTLAGDFSAGIRETLAAQPGVHAGLALASAASAWLNAGLLWFTLQRTGLAPPLPWASVAKALLGCVLMSTLLLWLTPPLTEWLELDIAARIAMLGGLVGLGALTYAAALLTQGVRPAELIHRTSRPTDQ